MRAFGFNIAGFVVCLTQQVVLAASDFSQVAIDNVVLLFDKMFLIGNSLIKKYRHRGPYLDLSFPFGNDRIIAPLLPVVNYFEKSVAFWER